MSEGKKAPEPNNHNEGTPAVPVDKHRMQLDFTPDGYKNLKALAKEMGDISLAATIRNGLRVLAWLLSAQKKGGIVHVQVDGQMKQVEFVW